MTEILYERGPTSAVVTDSLSGLCQLRVEQWPITATDQPEDLMMLATELDERIMDLQKIKEIAITRAGRLIGERMQGR